MELQNFIFQNKPRKLLYRLKIKDEPLINGWSKWLIQPSDGYIETEKDGPVAWGYVEWIDIDPFERMYAGSRVQEKLTDHSHAIAELLGKLHINFIAVDKWIRII